MKFENNGFALSGQGTIMVIANTGTGVLGLPRIVNGNEATHLGTFPTGIDPMVLCIYPKLGILDYSK